MHNYIFLLVVVIVGLLFSSCKKSPDPDKSTLYIFYELNGQEVEFFPVYDGANTFAWPSFGTICENDTCDMASSFTTTLVNDDVVSFSFNQPVPQTDLVLSQGNYRYKDLAAFSTLVEKGTIPFCDGTAEPCIHLQFDVAGRAWGTQEGWSQKPGGINGDGFNRFVVTEVKKFNLSEVDKDDLDYYNQLSIYSVRQVMELDVNFNVKLYNTLGTDSITIENGRAKLLLTNK